jgi:hypothetical protein
MNAISRRVCARLTKFYTDLREERMAELGFEPLDLKVLCGCNKCGCARELQEGQPIGDMCNDCFVHCHRPTSPRGDMRRKMEER